MIKRYVIGVLVVSYMVYAYFSSGPAEVKELKKNYLFEVSKLEEGSQVFVYDGKGPNSPSTRIIGNMTLDADFLDCIKSGEIDSGRFVSDNELIIAHPSYDVLIQLFLRDGIAINARIYKYGKGSAKKSMGRMKINCDIKGYWEAE